MPKLVLVIAVFMCMLGCDPTPPQPASTLAPNGQNTRFKVTTAQQFNDGDFTRTILVLQDSETGKEYLAVTGAGVTEIICHPKQGCHEE